MTAEETKRIIAEISYLINEKFPITAKDCYDLGINPTSVDLVTRIKYLLFECDSLFREKKKLLKEIDDLKKMIRE